MFKSAELERITNGDWRRSPRGELAITGVSTDTRTLAAGDLFVALAGDSFDGHEYAAAAAKAGAAAVVAERHVDVDIPVLLVDSTLRALQRLGRAHRERFDNLTVVAITGSCGKTSSKEIIAGVLQQHVGADAVLMTRGNTNNQIGVPQNLLRLQPQHRAAVLELGTNRPGEIATLAALAQPHVAVITNVGPVHLEGLGDLDGVAREKSAIFSGLRPGGLGVITAELYDNDIVRAALPSRCTVVGEGDQAAIRIEYLGGDLTSSRFRVWRQGAEPLEVTWPLTGRHMALNAAAAVAVGEELGVADDTLVAGLAAGRTTGMRMRVQEVDGVTWVNDAYNAGPASMRALIDWLAETTAGHRLVLVLGDMLELGESAAWRHREVLAHARERLPAAELITFGPLFAAVASDAEHSFTELAPLRAALAELLSTRDCIALKGSRGMALERLLPSSAQAAD